MNMKKILKHISLVSVCASVGFSLLAIKAKYIKCTNNPLKLKLVSPAYGVAMLESNVLKKYYDFGLTGKDDLGRNTVHLIKSIFYVVPNSSRLSTTNSKNSIPYHFSLNIIAKLIGDSHRSRYENEEQKCIDNYKNIILSDEGFKESTRNKKQKSIRRKVNRFSRTLVKSLQECGYYGTEKNSVYPEGMTHGILLAFLCSKMRDKKDIHRYFKVLQSNLKSLLFIDKEQEKLAYSKKVYSTAQDDIDCIVKNVERLSKKSSKSKSVYLLDNEISYEDMVFAEIVRPKLLPRDSKFDWVEFFTTGREIPDCIETMINDICNLKLYDQEKNRYSLSRFKFQPDEKLKKFYKEHCNASDDLNHSAWAFIVTNRPCVAYSYIVQINGDKKVVKLPDGFEGFIYGIDMSLGLRKKVEVLFESETYSFDQIIINQRKYIAIDPKEYLAFEVQGNIMNVIVLLNTLLGLRLYKDIKAAFFEEQFDEKYFPILCDKLGWKYEILNGELKNKYSEKEKVTVGLNVNGNQVLLKWQMYCHGEVENKVCCMPPYRNNLLDSLVEALKNKTNKSYSDLISLFTLYYYPSEKRFRKDREAFLNFHCLRRHLYFLQDLNDDDIKCSIIKTILKYEDDPYLFALARKLISSLAVNDDVSYQEKMINFFFGMKEGKKRKRFLELFSGSLDQLYDVINGSKGIKKKVSLYKQAVLNNMYFKQAEDVALEAISCKFIDWRMSGFRLLISLVNVGQAHKKAEEVSLKMSAETDEEREVISRLKEALNQKFPQ